MRRLKEIAYCAVVLMPVVSLAFALTMLPLYMLWTMVSDAQRHTWVACDAGVECLEQGFCRCVGGKR